MKNGEEIGFKFIKTKATATTDKLKTIQYEVNQIVYDNNKRYISPTMGERLKKQLVEYGKSLKELNVGEKYKAKKDEMLDQLRTLCKQLNEYIKTFQWEKMDAAQVERTMKYQLREYLKNKETLNVEDYLQRNLEIWEEMYLPCPFSSAIDVSKFVSMQEELQERYCRKYDLKR